MATDKFAKFTYTPDSPCTNAATLTGNSVDQVTRAVYVGVTGNLSVQMAGGANVTFQAIPAGTWLDIRVQQIYSNSTANGIVGLY